MASTVERYEKENSKLAELRARCLAAHTAAQGFEEDAFAYHLDNGQALIEIKAELKGQKGAFGKYCGDAFAFTSRTWRAKLMRVAENVHRLPELFPDEPMSLERAYHAIRLDDRLTAGKPAPVKKKSLKVENAALKSENATLRAKIIRLENELRNRGAKRRAA
jgi:hypothetical protein